LPGPRHRRPDGDRPGRGRGAHARQVRGLLWPLPPVRLVALGLRHGGGAAVRAAGGAGAHPRPGGRQGAASPFRHRALAGAPHVGADGQPTPEILATRDDRCTSNGGPHARSDTSRTTELLGDGRPSCATGRCQGPAAPMGAEAPRWRQDSCGNAASGLPARSPLRRRTWPCRIRSA